MSDETTVTASQLLQPQLIFLPKLIWFNSQFWFSYVFIFLTRLISRDDVVILDSLNYIKGNFKVFFFGWNKKEYFKFRDDKITHNLAVIGNYYFSECSLDINHKEYSWVKKDNYW